MRHHTPTRHRTRRTTLVDLHATYQRLQHDGYTPDEPTTTIWQDRRGTAHTDPTCAPRARQTTLNTSTAATQHWCHCVRVEHTSVGTYVLTAAAAYHTIDTAAAGAHLPTWADVARHHTPPLMQLHNPSHLPLEPLLEQAQTANLQMARRAHTTLDTSLLLAALICAAIPFTISLPDGNDSAA